MYLHIDIDSFFVSAERSVDYALKNIPVAVGGRSNLEIFNKKRTHIKLMNDNSGAFVAPVFYSDKKKNFESVFVDNIEGRKKIRGIVTTSSYEARAFGVKTAMPIAQALQICPSLVVVPSHYPLYHKLSHQIHQFVQERIPKVEQYSIDEFFCDLGGWVDDDKSYAFAQKIQREIFECFDIPVSIGISKAKWIAKLATEFAKPFGIYEVKDIGAFTKEIPIKEFPGIGKGFQKRLEANQIFKLGEIAARKSLFYSWKKPGIQLYHRVTGTDNEPINRRVNRKSIGISRTFDKISDANEVRRRMIIMARHIVYMALAIDVNPTRYYLKINYEYGLKEKQTRTVNRLFSESLFKRELLEMYNAIYHQNSGAIKLTVNVSDFTSNHFKTLSFLELEADQKAVELSRSLQSVRKRFGLDIIKTANEL